MKDDPNALAALVTQLGGTPIEGETFRFDLPREEVSTVVPKLNAVLGEGIGVRKVSERIDDHPTRYEVRTVTTLELYRREPKDFDPEKSLMGRMRQT